MLAAGHVDRMDDVLLVPEIVSNLDPRASIDTAAADVDDERRGQSAAKLLLHFGARQDIGGHASSIAPDFVSAARGG